MDGIGRDDRHSEQNGKMVRERDVTSSTYRVPRRPTIETTAAQRRVCSCLCSVHHRAHGICERFIEPGQPVVLEELGMGGDHAFCVPCAVAGGLA